MPRYSAAGRGVTNLPTTVAGPCIYPNQTTPRKLSVREVGVFNTSTTEVAVGLMRGKTSIGTGVGSVTIAPHDFGAPASTSLAWTSNSGTPTSDGTFVQATLAAAKGAGTVWTFGDTGLVIPASTTASLQIVCPVGTAQFLDFYFIWDE